MDREHTVETEIEHLQLEGMAGNVTNLVCGYRLKDDGPDDFHVFAVGDSEMAQGYLAAKVFALVNGHDSIEHECDETTEEE